MPLITVQMLEGRTAAQKKALISGLSEITGKSLDVPDEAIRITLIEIPSENWGIGGRTMADIRGKAPPTDEEARP